jgi:hypothetical protein
VRVSFGELPKLARVKIDNPFSPFGSHDAPVRRPLEMARPRRRCCSCSWRPRNDRVHPYHTLFALLFALFPFPPLLFSLFLLRR